MKLDEQGWMLLLVGFPIPFLLYIIKVEPMSFLAVIPFYMGLSVVGPLYLQSRDQGVYKKAELICWLKIAGASNFFPNELEILHKALGKEINKPLKKATHPLLKYWKPIFIIAILTSSYLVWTEVAPAEQAIDDREIKFIDISVNLQQINVDNKTIQPRQLLYATLSLNLSSQDKVFLSSVEVYSSTGHLIGKEYFGRHYTGYTKGVFIQVILERPLPVHTTITLKAIFRDETRAWEGKV